MSGSIPRLFGDSAYGFKNRMSCRRDGEASLRRPAAGTTTPGKTALDVTVAEPDAGARSRLPCWPLARLVSHGERTHSLWRAGPLPLLLTPRPSPTEAVRRAVFVESHLIAPRSGADRIGSPLRASNR